MITSWRITAREYAESAFDGEGAAFAGGRWNSRGRQVVYTSSSAALATLEILVNIDELEPFSDFVLFACSFDEALVERLDRALLPEDWRRYPAPARLKQLGDEWIARQPSAVLEVPSAVIETESNYLFSPAHTDFRKIEIADPVPFSLDLRLLKR